MHAELEVLQVQFAETPEFVEEVVPAEMAINPEFLAWEKERRRVMSDRAGLRGQGLTKSVQNAREEQYSAQLEDIEKTLVGLERLVERVPQQVHDIPNEQHYKLSLRIKELEASQRGLDALLESLVENKRKSGESLDALLRCENQHSFWEMRIAANRKSYERLADKFSELETLRSLEGQDQSNLRILQQATLPTEKDGPQRLSITLVGAMAGLFLGLLLAVARQILDRRLRYPETVERLLGQPVLTVIPETPALRKFAPQAVVSEEQSQEAA